MQLVVDMRPVLGWLYKIQKRTDCLEYHNLPPQQTHRYDWQRKNVIFFSRPVYMQ